MMATLFYNPTFQDRFTGSVVVALLVCAAIVGVWAWAARKRKQTKPALFRHLVATAIGLLVFAVFCGLLMHGPAQPRL